LSLPHRFPFELVDRVDGSAARVRPTSGAWWRWGDDGPGLSWLVEAAAQATARVLGDGATAGEEELALGGVEAARLDRPLPPGADVVLRPRIERRMGDVARAVVEVEVDGTTAGEVALLLLRRSGTSQGSK